MYVQVSWVIYFVSLLKNKQVFDVEANLVLLIDVNKNSVISVFRVFHAFLNSNINMSKNKID